MLKTLIASKIKDKGEQLTIDQLCRDMIVNKCVDLVEDEFVKKLEDTIEIYADTTVKTVIDAYIEEKMVIKFKGKRGSEFGIRTDFGIPMVETEEDYADNEEDCLLERVMDIGDIIQFTCGTKLELAKIIKPNPSSTTVVVLLTNGKIEEIKESDIVNVIRF